MSVMLASDEANPAFMGARNPDSALHVRFYSRPIQNLFRTQQEGHPIFEDVDYVEIHTPGSQLNIIDTPVREDHKRRFPLHWAHFQNTHGKDSKVVGTPINQWPLLTSAQSETVKGLGFLTVEQVAFASDEQVGKLGMHAGMAPHAFRDRAKRFLEAAQGEAAINKQAQEMESLKKQIADLTAMLVNRGTEPQVQVAPVDLERAELAAQYEQKFGKKPHHKLSVASLKEKLA
jgi:hypothetical protein